MPEPDREGPDAEPCRRGVQVPEPLRNEESKICQDMKREVKIGIFAVAMIVAAWAGIRFLKGFDIFGRNTVYYAAYDQIGGVQSASRSIRN